MPSSRASTSALLLLSHGSPDPEWSAPMLRLRDILGSRDPERTVALAFLPPAAPTFKEVVDQLAMKGFKHITVAPVFLARGGHVKKDLPEMATIAREQWRITIDLLPTLGESDAVLNAAADWIGTQTIAQSAPLGGEPGGA